MKSVLSRSFLMKRLHCQWFFVSSFASICGITDTLWWVFSWRHADGSLFLKPCIGRNRSRSDRQTGGRRDTETCRLCWQPSSMASARLHCSRLSLWSLVSKISTKEPLGSMLRKVKHEASLFRGVLNKKPYLPDQTKLSMNEKPSMDDNPWAGQKIGRNDPCPCGSGLKYKKCHGKNL